MPYLPLPKRTQKSHPTHPFSPQTPHLARTSSPTRLPISCPISSYLSAYLTPTSQKTYLHLPYLIRITIFTISLPPPDTAPKSLTSDFRSGAAAASRPFTLGIRPLSSRVDNGLLGLKGVRQDRRFGSQDFTPPKPSTHLLISHASTSTIIQLHTSTMSSLQKNIPAETPPRVLSPEDVHNDLFPEVEFSPVEDADTLCGPGKREFHPTMTGQPCNRDGIHLPPNIPPPPLSQRAKNDWTPYRSRLEFETANFLFKTTQISKGNTDTLLMLWSTSLLEADRPPPFANTDDLHNVIDATTLGDAPWLSFAVNYNGTVPPQNPPPWMTADYEVFYRDPHVIIQNLFANPDFDGEMDYVPYREFNIGGDRRYKDFMSANWAWRHADIIIGDDPALIGSLLIPIILGSDKTTVSVATGNNEYYPLYLSIGNVYNNVRRAHRNALVLIGFLSIPKTEKKYKDNVQWRKFRRQLFHSSLSAILEPLRPWMTTPYVMRCPDGHFRRAIYDLAVYIADYPEQVLCSGIVQGWCPKCDAPHDDLDRPSLRRTRIRMTALKEELDLGTLWDDYGIVGDVIPFTQDFPRADIHEMISGDLLHQIIKGAFKDHLVTWVGEYLVIEHGEAKGAELLDQIDRRIAASPSFPGLRRFPQGRGFKQWTGDDSKALMKVYLPAISGIVPSSMVQAIAAFMEFCYIMRRDVIDEQDLEAAKAALTRFEHYRVIFQIAGVRPTGFSLPRMHSLQHYLQFVRDFGAPNGLCSSITEAKHIKAVKEPWRRSSRFEALGQMLLTNQRLDKLSASHADFTACEMLDGTCLSAAIKTLVDDSDDDPDDDFDDSDDDAVGPPTPGKELQPINDTFAAMNDQGPTAGPQALSSVVLASCSVRSIPKDIDRIAAHYGLRLLPSYTARFLHEQLHLDVDDIGRVPDEQLPLVSQCRARVFPSAITTFYAPSDPSGIGGMHHERTRATPLWRRRYPRYDCVFVSTGPGRGMRGMHIARVRLFFSFTYAEILYPCAFVEWFVAIDDNPDSMTGMWIVEPELDNGGERVVSVIHIDTIVRSAHLLPVFDTTMIPSDFHFSDSLDAFMSYYVNKYVDHHAFEIAL
ncbi:hypothetical protein QCA50_019321 [Cerrena zonata]|uniref:Uncharacterized protein n=1 Tax=Cerrena zonata TaxID=2478898 RepID=A0AAW0FHZ9_9APHY